jgi:YVTN family beta-propeller protein
MLKGSPQSPPCRQARRRGKASRRVNPRAAVAIATFGGLLPALLLFGGRGRDSTALAQGTATGANSSPIAISNDNRFVWAVNPDTNTVSAAIVANDVNLKVVEVSVGREPQCVAIANNNRTAFVTNQVDGTVTVIDIPGGEASLAQAKQDIRVGTEPYGCVLTPDGTKLYVANSTSNSVSVIDTRTLQVVKTIPSVGVRPMGLGIVNNKLYVTQFFAQLRPNGRPIDQNEGADDGREGRVTVIDTNTDAVVKTITLAPLDPAKVGFKSNGTTLGKIPPRTDPNNNNAPIFDFDIGCFPNLLQSVVIKGNRAYLPAIGSSPNGPFRFDVNCQAILSVIDTVNDVEDVNQTINMNKGVDKEDVKTRLFLSNPWAIAFKRNSNEGWVVASGIDQIVRVQLGADGAPTINAPTPLRINLSLDAHGDFRTGGKNPRGIVINGTDTRAYVINLVSRDISAINLQNNTFIGNIQMAGLPAAGTLEATVLRGKQLFNTGIGPAGTDPNFPGSQGPGGVMSARGWGNCFSCHPNGWTDSVTWMFADGPRQTISLDSTFDHRNPNHVRILNWSSIRDEVHDFELNTRAVFGGQGLITDATGKQDPDVFSLVRADGSLAKPNTGRSADLDALAAYQAFGIRSLIGPAPDPTLSAQGLQLFKAANCIACHGGSQWTRAIRDFNPAQGGLAFDFSIGAIVDVQLLRFLNPVGTFNPAHANELRANANVGGQVPVARGALGFNSPSLIGVFATAPYFHDGSAQTLEEVMANVPHRIAGTAGFDLFAPPDNIRAMVEFLKSIDATSQTLPGP